MFRNSTSRVKRVLLVEDNAGDALLFREAFQESGATCELTIVRDGETACAMLLGKTVCPDLILLDLNLPKKSGLEVLQELKTHAECLFIPIVILSTSKASSDIEAAYRLRCNAYLHKPSTFAELSHLARLIIDFWLELVLLPAANA